MESDPNIMPDMNWHPIERLCKIGRFIADRFYSDVPHVIDHLATPLEPVADWPRESDGVEPVQGTFGWDSEGCYIER